MLTVGTKVSGNKSTWEQKFHITFAPGNESSRERKFQGAKVPSMELSFLGTKVRENESSIIHFLSLRTEIYMLKALFSISRDGKVSKPEAIFCPPRTEKKTMQTLFSVHADGNINKLEAIFRLPLTKK